MGVSSTTNRLTYSGDGSTTSFSFPYYFFYQTDLLVYLYDTILGGTVLQTLNSTYTISGTPNAQGLYPSGASVVFGSAPANTSVIVIIRSPSAIQNYALLQNGAISSTAIVQQFDYLTLLIQRMQDQINRSVIVPDGVGAAFTNGLPTTLAQNPGAGLLVNNTGNGFSFGNEQIMQSVQVPYTALRTSGSTNQVLLFSLPASSVLQFMAIKHSTAFAGTSITDVTAQLGISSNFSLFIPAFDIFQSVGDQVFDNFSSSYIGSFANTTGIYLQATSSGANLSALTQGLVNVYYQYSAL